MTGSVLRSISSFLMQQAPKLPPSGIQAALEKLKFKSCGATDWASSGFVPPFDGEDLALFADGAFWVQLQTEKKILPASVVNRLLKERVKKMQKDLCRKIGRKEKKELKETIIDELLPRALTGQSSTLAVVDPKMGFVLIGEGSNKKAEAVINLLSQALEDLKTSMVDYPESITGHMTDLLMGGQPCPFDADASLTLKGIGTGAPSVKFAQFLLEKPEVLAHLTEGLLPTEIALSWQGQVSFVLTDKFVIKKLCFIDGDAADDPDSEADPAVLLQAQLLIQLELQREIFRGFAEWFGKPAAVGQHPDAANDSYEQAELAEAAE